MKVQQLLRTKGTSPLSVHPAVTIRDLVDMLHKDHTGAAIVHDDNGALDGIVTERDIVQAVVKYGCASLGLPAAALVTTAVASCTPNDSLTEVARIMAERKIHHIAVRKDGRVINVLSIVDVLDERIHDRRRITRAMLETGILIN